MTPLHNAPSAPRECTALLCIEAQNVLQTAIDQLAPLGFAVHTVTTPEQALTHLYSHSCDVMVVSDTFGGGDAEAHPVLSQLASVPLDLRRKLFVILLGSNLTPHSKMQAFALSVDLVLQPQDVANLKELVSQGLAAHQEFYAAFNAVHSHLHQEG